MLSRLASSVDVIPYVTHTEKSRQEMLKVIGVKSIDDLFTVIPASVRCKGMNLPAPKSEIEVEREMRELAALNLDCSKAPCFLGAGSYNHKVPAAVDHVIQRSEFLTAYTPYQPEISQGTLQSLFEYQTMTARILGMDVSNASMYDGSTACAEAIMMACRCAKPRKNVIMSGGLHPHYRDVCKTYVGMSGCGEIITPEGTEKLGDPKCTEDLLSLINAETACVVVQNPSVYGHIIDLKPIADACHKFKALLIAVTTEPISLGLLKSPGEMGADIAVAEGQSLAGPMSFGGPGLGVFACKKQFMRQMPGRLVGQTKDVDGNRVWVLTLGTREQHIRREKATSNICTSSGVMATSFAMHLALLGEVGFRDLANLNHAQAVKLAKHIKKGVPNVDIINNTFFNEFTLGLPESVSAKEVIEKMAKKGVLGGVPASRLFGTPEADNMILVAATEQNTCKEMEKLVSTLKLSL